MAFSPKSSMGETMGVATYETTLGSESTTNCVDGSNVDAECAQPSHNRSHDAFVSISFKTSPNMFFLRMRTPIPHAIPSIHAT